MRTKYVTPCFVIACAKDDVSKTYPKGKDDEWGLKVVKGKFFISKLKHGDKERTLVCSPTSSIAKLNFY